MYIDPNSFKECLESKSDQNIGVHLYQRLMKNYRDENQPNFGRQAAFKFNTWMWRQLLYEFKAGWASKPIRSLKELFRAVVRMIWGLCGAGVYLARFIICFAFILFAFSAINFFYREKFGLVDIKDYFDSLYFTVITMTTVGYGDITPLNTAGKIAIALQGAFGFFLFAFAASIFFRRIWP